MSDSHFIVPPNPESFRGNLEPSLFTRPEGGPEHQRSNSAPLQTAWLVDDAARRASKAELETDPPKHRHHQSDQDEYSGLSESPARSGPRLPSSVATESRASVKRPGPTAAAYAAPSIGRALKTMKERSSTEGSEGGASSAIIIAGPVWESPEQPAHLEEEGVPSKRVKSDIAPWMTQRHKNAIRRSLGASAELLHASSSPSRAAAGDEEEARIVQTTQDDQSR